MNVATVSRTLSMIPERTPRMQTGCAFTDEEAARCQHPDRIGHVMKFLSWLGPLNPLTKDDLRILDLLNQYGRPVSNAHAVDEAMDDEETLESEEDLEPPLDEVGGVFSEATLPPPAAPAQ